MIDDEKVLFNLLKNDEDYKKLKIRYPDYKDEDFIFALFSIGLVASRNCLHRSLFEDILKQGLKS